MGARTLSLPRARREAEDGRRLVTCDNKPRLADERAHELGLEALLDGVRLARVRHADVKSLPHVLLALRCVGLICCHLLALANF